MNHKSSREEQMRLIIFVGCATLFVMIWQVAFKPETNRVNKESANQSTTINPSQPIEDSLEKNTNFLDAEQSITHAQSQRIKIENDTIIGSINLSGATIDDYKLKNYHINNDKKEAVRLLYPRDTKGAHFAVIGWIPISGISPKDTPGPNTMWTAKNKELTTNKPLELTFNNNKGQIFIMRLSINNCYQINIEQQVINKSNKTIQLQPFASISQLSPYPYPKEDSYNGPLGFFNGKFQEIPYKKLTKNNISFTNQINAWGGISHKYWLTSILTSEESDILLANSSVTNNLSLSKIIFRYNTVNLNQDSSKTHKFSIFAGAKNIGILDKYEKNHNAILFSRAIDLGYLYLITKPLLHLLQWLNSIFGNYGVSIIIMTILVRIALFPLANKSYKSISKIRKLNPRIAELKEMHKDDKKSLNVALIELYQKEKINPLASLVPLILQIPVFFALYKALSVSLDLRHSVFINGWINDLSAPDPTCIFNLFGLLPFNTPTFLQIGILPILMGITMWIQQKQSSVDTLNSDQTKAMQYIPILFTFLFAHFPSGLVLYWVVTNICSILQQMFIESTNKQMVSP